MLKLFMSDESYILKPNEEQLPGLEISEHVDRIESIIGWLKSKGLNVSSSRIPGYKKFLKSFIGIQQLDPAANDEDRIIFDKFLYTLREVHELMWIQKGFQKNEPTGTTDLLKTIIGGHSFAKDDKDTVARNIQFELRIASYFLQNDFDVDLSQITDIVAKKSKITFFIECKRIGSPNQINKRAKEAAKQLKRRVGKSNFLTKNVGLAVFDVTKIAFPHQGLTGALTYEHCKKLIQDKLKEIDGSYDFAIPFENNHNVIAFWLQIHIPSLQMANGYPTTRFSSVLKILEPNSGFRNSAVQELKKVIKVYDYSP